MSGQSTGFSEIAYAALILVGVTGTILLASRTLRWLPLVLACQYAGVFLLVVISWSFELALVKLTAGWMAALLLGVTQMNLAEDGTEADRVASNSVFRLLAALLSGFAMLALSSRIQGWIPNVTPEAAAGGSLMIGLGLMHIGLTDAPMRVILGLLTVLSGFEILYASLERSVVMAGLLAALTLGLALVGAYLVAVPKLEETE